MNHRTSIFLVAITVVVGAFAASAFSASRVDARAVTSNVVGDSAAFLSIQKDVTSPHASFVTQNANGKISVSFGTCACATGTGVNADSIYEWDDLIKITNQGTQTVYVKVTTSSTTGTLTAAIESTAGQMTDSDYSAATTPVAVTVGSTVYLGLKADSTGLTSGQTVTGTFTVYATRTSAGTL